MDRRQFLISTASTLAAGAVASCTPQAPVPVAPKRLVMVVHRHGRVVGNGSVSGGIVQDLWSPLPATGDLPPSMSPLLASLAQVRSEIVTIDGIDNIIRHTSGDADGELSAGLTALTCLRPNGPPLTIAGPSLDFVAGQRLADSPQSFPSAVFPASPDDFPQLEMFAGAGGSAPRVLSSRPEVAAQQLVGLPQGSSPIQGASLVDPGAVPAYNMVDASRGRLDGVLTPWQVKNVVSALATDTMRSAALVFQLGYDPVFASEFEGTSPFESTNWHGAIHNSPMINGADVANVVTAFQHYGKMFTLLVEGLAAVRDVDGRRLLDNTLVVWVSELGYGASHYDWNIPVVIAGMRDQFPGGQGRHINVGQRSLGDLYAQALRMIGGADTTYGGSGLLGNLVASGADLNPWSARGGSITTSSPTHFGPLPL